jgi:hypothetical protein
MEKKKWEKYAELIKKVSQEKTPERAEKCGYDLFMGLSKGDAEDRYDAWKRFLEESDGPHTDAERDGVWVPAIEVK